MNRATVVCAVMVALAAAGCTNKDLMKQKDAQIADLQARNDQLQQQLGDQKKMTDDLNTQLADLQEQKRVLIQERDGLTQITLNGSATFPSANADLSRDGKEAIDRVWSVLQNYPDRHILVEGHTDDRPIRPDYRHVFASNWDLSSARALAVLHYIEHKYGPQPDRLSAVGYGEFRPVADNSTRAGRAQNRRVVITVGSKMDIQQRQIQADSLTVGSPENLNP
ncbi:MAG TPA: OmpA family protein [Candidatus Krumholzibacteria bacterium]|nr:OmpA family protein [Candidatus Krumholzibacteria bacterium]